MKITDEQIVSELLYPCWQSIDRSYKEQYMKTIWEQFQNRINSALKCNNLNEFYTKLQRHLPLNMHTSEIEKVANFIKCGEDRFILNKLRKELPTLVLFTRLKNEEAKEIYKKTLKDKE
jgi:hypothetical protein